MASPNSRIRATLASTLGPPAIDADGQDEQPERGHRQDRGEDQGQRQAGPEAHPARG